jgi:hypothetical protein
LKQYNHAILVAAAIAVLPGVSLSFVTNDPVRRWKDNQSASYSFSDPWFPSDFRPAIDQAAFSWSSAGALWSFDAGSPVQGYFYGVEDRVNLIDFITGLDPNTPGQTRVFRRPDDPTDIVEWIRHST